MDEFDLHKEPEFHFTPLSVEKYCEFYDAELARFEDDLPFYLQHTKPGGVTLELGCGTGRLTRKLAGSGQQMTGIDISLPMLQRAKRCHTPAIHYLRADISHFFLHQQFDTIIIPYNTLNLLADQEHVHNCLHTCRGLLRDRGQLLMQLFVPDREIIDTNNKKLFQFQIFTGPDGSKIIKEIIKSYGQEHNRLVLEERYRVRTNTSGIIKKEDYSHTMELLAFDSDTWFQMIVDAGFSITKQYGTYQLKPYLPLQNSCLLLAASPY